jgi:hypothetical protein
LDYWRSTGYTRIPGALKNVGHRVGRSTIARILKVHGIPPVPERPTAWQTFFRAHSGAITARFAVRHAIDRDKCSTSTTVN